MLYWGFQIPEKPVKGYINYLQDQVVFYKGMYGVPSYVVWYMAPDKTYWIYPGDIFEFMIFDAPDYKTTDVKNFPFVDDMIVLNIIFDVQTSMFKLTAVSAFWYRLANTKMLKAIDVGTFDNPVTGIEVIERLVDIANKGQKKRAGVAIKNLIENKKRYISINEDPEVSVLDKITDICLDNSWEWYIGQGKIEGRRQNMVYIGNQLVLEDVYTFPFEPEAEHKQLIETSRFMNITTESVWAEPLSSYNNPFVGRAIWVKYFLGNEGGLMSAMFQKSGWDLDEYGKIIKTSSLKFLTENEFIETLDYGLAKEYGFQRLFKYPLRNFSILVGKMFGEVTNQHKNNYSIPKWSGDLKIKSKNLDKRMFKTEFTDKEIPVNYLKNGKMTTPFAGNGVGMLFPQVEGYKTLFSPDGERDAGLIGPGYFGPEDQVPVRGNAKDFRLQMPNNSMLYYDEDQGEWILAGNKIFLTIGSSPPDDYDTPNEAALEIASGEATLYGNGWSAKINLTTSEVTIQGGSIKIDGGTVDINGVTIMKGGIIKCQMLTTSGGVVPPNLL